MITFNLPNLKEIEVSTFTLHNYGLPNTVFFNISSMGLNIMYSAYRSGKNHANYNEFFNRGRLNARKNGNTILYVVDFQ